MFPQYFEVMKPNEGSEQDLDNPSYDLQIKFDGTRAIIFKRGHMIQIIGRSWKNDYALKFPEIVQDILSLPVESCILDSELTYFDSSGKDVFLTTLASPETKRGLIAKCMVFDLLEVNDNDVRQLPFEKRMEILNMIIKSDLEHLVLVSTYPNSSLIYREIVAQGFEGVVLKHKSSQYQNGKSSLWKKVKRVATEDCIVVGITEGKGSRNELFGSLILAQITLDGRLKYVGRTSGFDNSEMLRLYNKVSQLRLSFPLNISVPNHVKVKYWCKPQIVVEVLFGNKTDNEHLRFPRFIRERTDKNPSECLMS